MNVFKTLRVYAGKWMVTDSRKFTEEEINEIKDAYVVDSQYGSSVCFIMRSGGQAYIPLSSNSSLSVGEKVDLTKARLLTLHRDGSADINRVDI